MRQPSCIAKGALIIFADHSELKWLWPLKRGFRHCFTVIEGRASWVVYNPLSHYTDIEIYPFYKAREISEFYQGLGYTVVTARVLQPPTSFRLRHRVKAGCNVTGGPCSCVCSA